MKRIATYFRRLGAPNAHRPVRWLMILSVAIALGSIALGSFVMYQSYKDVWEDARQSANNLSLALVTDIERTINVYDLSIQAVSDGLKVPGIADVSPTIRNMALFDHAATAEFFGSLLVVDKNGDIVADSTSITPHSFNLSDRRHFLVHKNDPNIGLYISRPIQARLFNSNPYIITLSRRLNEPDGGFGGIIVGSLRVAYFQHLFGNLDLGPHGSVTLMRDDFRVIARQPLNPDDIDSDLSNAPISAAIKQAPSGELVGYAGLDHVRRFYLYRRVGDFPLTLDVALSVDDIYAKWRAKAELTAALLAILCSATIGLCIMLRRELYRRIETEACLNRAIEQISHLAATDGLTGLANRRTFDAALDQEWRRAIREETPVALLMMDADCFKQFNDTYGHQQGDQVLRVIAGCVQSTIRRPGDIAARYGGEEFVVLLPSTEAAGAAVIAERIRVAVAARGIEHAHSPMGIVTISLGVAVCYPRHAEPPGVLIAAADDALYEAKMAGRNRVEVDRRSTPIAQGWQAWWLGSSPLSRSVPDGSGAAGTS